MTHEPRIFVTVERTFNLGNFEREKINIGLSGLPFEADDAYIQSGLDTADRALAAIRGRMRSSIADIRQEPPVTERRANHRALDEIPIDETGIDITSSTGLGCVVCGDMEGLTECDLGMVCPSCLADIADDLAEAVDETTEGGMIPGDADQDGQPEPVLLAIDPPSVATSNPSAAESKPEAQIEAENQPVPGHPEGCHCNACGWDPFADESEGVPCPLGCQCGDCLRARRSKCSKCDKPRPEGAAWWLEGDVVICNECKGVPSQEMQALKYEGPAKVEETPATSETDPRAHIYNGPVCERCGMGEIATTYCPGTVITAAQGQNIVRGLMDYINGGWKVAGAPGNTHKFPGNNIPLKNSSTQNDFPTAECLPPTESGAPVEQSAGSVETTDRTSPPKTDKPSEMAATSEKEDIPGEDEISTKLSIFSVNVDIPPMEWAKEPLTEVSTEGEGGGQMKALNTVLSLIGYKGKDRHWASLAILHAAFGPFRGTLDSLKDLTKAEAHVILSYLDAATPESKVLLFDAACAMKGQIPLRLSPTETEVAA